MKISRIKTKSVALFFSSTIMLVSCSKEEIERKTIENKIQAIEKNYISVDEMNGEDIFKGMFFLQNDLLNEVESVKDLKIIYDKKIKENPEINKNMIEYSQEVTEYIKTKYDGFFTEFEKSMRSGNYYEIEKKLDLATHMIKQASVASKKYGKAAALINEVDKSEDLMVGIINIDLNEEGSEKKLNNLLEKYSIENDLGGDFEIEPFSLVFYLAAAIVSIAAVIYSVVTAVAYWSLEEVYDGLKELVRLEKIDDKKLIQREIIIKDFSNVLQYKL